jgi:hypothetical protein
MVNFRDEIHKLRWYNVYNNQDTNVSFDLFWEDFNTLFELHFPLTKTKFNRNIHKINEFMTSGLLISRKTKITLHKKAVVNPTLFYERYKIFRNIFNSTLRLSKKLFLEAKFRAYEKNPKKTWDLLKEVTFGKTSNIPITELLINNTPCTDPWLIANEFNNFFSTIGSKISESVLPTDRPPDSYIPNRPENSPELNFDFISPCHVLAIIKSLSNKNSLDLDGLSLKFIKFIAHDICGPLAHIFNLSLTQGIFPEKLKTSRIVPIFKSGEKNLCDNYRPISLVSSLSKILEKIVATKLTNYLQINNLLYEHQYGFQKNKSTEHNLLHVINYIGNALNKGNYCIGVFIDLRKAFDVCSHSILLLKLEKLGIKDIALEWFRSYLSGRKQKVEINGCFSECRNLDISVLQGTILGPILFLCYINDIFTASELATFLFADDTQCLAENKNLMDLIDFVNNELQKLANWFRANKMAVNVSKTNYIIFHTKGKSVNYGDRHIIFNNNIIGQPVDPNLIHNVERIYTNHPDPNKRTYKSLGVYLDEYLSFNKHVSHICAKISRSIFCIKRAANFLSLKSLKSLYYAMIHPHLLYCINIFSCTSQSNLNKILLVQKKAIRVITKENYNAHTAPLFKKLGILPFDKLLIQAKLNFMHAIEYNYAPSTFSSTFTKNNDRNIDHNLRNVNDFLIPFARIDLFKKIPLYSFPKAWNDDIGDLRFQRNKITFQIALKDHLLELI